MTNWDNLLENPDYTSDTGNAQKGDPFSRGQIKLGNQSGPNAIGLEEAFSIIGQLRGEPMLLVKTNKHGPHPGAFYAKAFVSKGAEWGALKRVLNENLSLGLHPGRKAWLCGPGRHWTDLNQ